MAIMLKNSGITIKSGKEKRFFSKINSNQPTKEFGMIVETLEKILMRILW